MNDAVCKLTNVKSVHPPLPPWGHYPGLWTGDQVRFNVGLMELVGTTAGGVKGINIPCIVTVGPEGYSVRVNMGKETL